MARIQHLLSAPVHNTISCCCLWGSQSGVRNLAWGRPRISPIFSWTHKDIGARNPDSSITEVKAQTFGAGLTYGNLWTNHIKGLYLDFELELGFIYEFGHYFPGDHPPKETYPQLNSWIKSHMLVAGLNISNLRWVSADLPE